MNIQTIDINGQKIRVAVRLGAENTTPLLLLNGIGASLELVLPLVMALHHDLTVIAFDVPGVGGSPTPSCPYNFSWLAKTVTQILDYLDYGQVNVLGLSWGGFLAQQFAYDHPKRCKKLVLAATSCGFMSAPPSLRVLWLMASPRRYTDPEYAASIAPEIYGGKFRHDKELCALHAKKMTSNKAELNGNTGYSFQMMALYCWTSLYRLHEIKQPTLLLAGNDDPIIPVSNMKLLANQISNSELYVFNDGHLFLLTDLPTVVPILNDFLL